MISEEHYTSAEEAFKSLNIGEKFDKRHAARRCKAIEKALNHGHWTKWATAGEYTTILRSGHVGVSMPFHKSVKLGQVNGTNDIVVFSDQYCFTDGTRDHCFRLQKDLAEKGVIIELFCKTYDHPFTPDEGYDRYNIDLKRVKMICSGYDYLYRGRLVGFIVKSER